MATAEFYDYRQRRYNGSGCKRKSYGFKIVSKHNISVGNSQQSSYHDDSRVCRCGNRNSCWVHRLADGIGRGCRTALGSRLILFNLHGGADVGRCNLLLHLLSYQYDQTGCVDGFLEMQL
jgi:hypothetical protein